MSQALSLRHQVGQLFLVGLSGTELSDVERAWLQLMRPGGFILFRRNIEQAAQTTTLLREAAQAAGQMSSEHIPALRAVDVEGGLVDRLRDLIAPSPSPAAVAATGRSRDAKRHGQLIGRSARLLGLNATFAPVLDLALPASASVMRTRVAGPTAEAVLRYAAPFLAGLHGERVLGCGKHFPGLGGGMLDSHAAMPSIKRTWEQLWDEDIAPYRDLLRTLPIVMVAHANYPLVQEAGSMPASVSRFWVTRILRKRLRYEGLILTDDMEMGGLLSQMSIEDASVAALLAGADLLEICKDPALVLRGYTAVLGEAERSAAFRALVRSACTRVLAHKRRLLQPLLPRNASPAQLASLRADIQSFAASLPALAPTGVSTTGVVAR